MNPKHLIPIFFGCILAIAAIPSTSELYKDLSSPAKWIFGALIFSATLYAYRDNFTAILNGPKVPHPPVPNNRDKERLRKAIKRLDKIYGFTFAMNVLKVERIWFQQLIPHVPNTDDLKWSLYIDVFRQVWCYRNGLPDDLLIATSQGVCGRAYIEGKGTNITAVRSSAFASAIANSDHYNFSRKQNEITKDIVLIISCPLWLERVDEYGKLNRWRVGVLNVESSSPGSESLYLSEELRLQLHEAVAGIAKTYLDLYP